MLHVFSLSQRKKIILFLFLFGCFVSVSYAQEEQPSTSASTELSEVIVNSVLTPEQVSFTVNKLDRKTIAKAPLGVDVPFLLSRYPSVVSYSDGGGTLGYTGMRIRGSDLTRINVTINGVPYNDAESHGVFFVNIPNILSSSKDVSLQRGVGVSAQGTSSFGGALAFNTLPEFTNRFEANASIGSFFSRTVALKKTYSPSSKLAIQANLSYSGTDGYRDRAWANLGSGSLAISYVPNQKFESSLALFVGAERVYLAWEGVDATQLSKQRTYNPLGYKKDGSIYPDQTDNYFQAHLQWINNVRFSPALTLHATSYYSKGGGYYQEYKEQQDVSKKYGVSFLPSRNEDLVRRLQLDNHLIGQQFLATYKAEHSASTFSLGVSGNVYLGRHFGTIVRSDSTSLHDYTYYHFDARKYDVQSFLRWEWTSSNRWFTYADVQWRMVDYAMQGFKDNPTYTPHVNYHFFNPKVGARLLLNAHHRLFASVGLAHREPVRSDFEEKPKQLPSPERLIDVEFGYAWKSKIVEVEANFYYMYYENQLVNTGLLSDVGGSIRTNVPQSYRAGAEISYALHLRKNLQFLGNTSISKNIIIEHTQYTYDAVQNIQNGETLSQTTIPFSPSVVNFMSLQYQPWSSLALSLSHQFVDRQFLDMSGQDSKSLTDYQTLNLSVAYELRTGKKSHLSIQFFCNNLTNSLYSHNGYAYTTIVENGKKENTSIYFPAAGINFSLALKWRIGSEP